jgi:hypothetical protein
MDSVKDCTGRADSHALHAIVCRKEERQDGGCDHWLDMSVSTITSLDDTDHNKQHQV